MCFVDNVKIVAKPARRLTLFYICNEIVQTCKRKRATSYKEAFQQVLPDATTLVRFVNCICIDVLN